MKVRAGSAVRGAGVGLACLLPGLGGRARAVLAAYAVGWPMGAPGLQLLVVVPDEDEQAWKRAVVPFATSAASWSAVMLLAVSAVRRSTLPAPVAGVLLGGGVVVGDSLLGDVGARLQSQAARRRAAGADEGTGRAPEAAADLAPTP
jgi:hypothetical protein